MTTEISWREWRWLARTPGLKPKRGPAMLAAAIEQYFEPGSKLCARARCVRTCARIPRARRRVVLDMRSYSAITTKGRIARPVTP